MPPPPLASPLPDTATVSLYLYLDPEFCIPRIIEIAQSLHLKTDRVISDASLAAWFGRLPSAIVRHVTRVGRI